MRIPTLITRVNQVGISADLKKLNYLSFFNWPASFAHFDCFAATPMLSVPGVRFRFGARDNSQTALKLAALIGGST